jgi:hypothetical protein
MSLRVTVEPTSAAEASNRFSSIFKVTNTTFYTLEDVRIEATLWCAKIGLGSNTTPVDRCERGMQSSRHILLVPAWLAVLGAQLNYPVSFRPDRAALVLAKSFLLPLALGMVVRRLFPAIAEQVGSRQVSARAYRAPALQRVNRISVTRKRVGAAADLTRLPGTDRRCDRGVDGRDLSPAETELDQ